MLSLITLILSVVALPSSDVIEGQYIVVFKKNVQTDKAIENMLSGEGLRNAEGVEVVHKFDIGSFKAATVRVPDSLERSGDMFANHEDIDHYEQDRYVYTFAEQTGAPWGLQRISSRTRPTTGALYKYPETAGAGIDAYVIDSGIFTEHPAFEGRATFGADFSGSGPGDGNGHGTHVAGTIGSSLYGVAKKVNLISVRVFDASGRGSNSNTLAGINWTIQKASANGGRIKAVANMSLGGPKSEAVNSAIAAATEAGIVIVAAAGNSAGDACNISPASAPSAITVASSDINDKIASTSEKGACVDVIAPGVGVLSTWNNGRTNTISGTSMAAPHVAGVVALALASTEYTSVAAVGTYIKSMGTPNKITGTLSGTPNSLLYSEFKI